MDYYSELNWMLPLTVATFTAGILLLVLFYKKKVFERWTKPRN